MGYNDRRWGSDDDRSGRDRGGYGRPTGNDRNDQNDRGFFDRAGDEVRSWFGDEEAERRRQYDERYDDRYDRGGRSQRDYGAAGGGYGGNSSGDANRGGYGSRDYDSRSDWRSGGTYGRSQGSWNDRDDARSRSGSSGVPVSGYGWGEDRSRGAGQDEGRGGYGRSQGQSQGRSGHDDHYSSWRDRQMQSLDRDYDDYRRENQSRFESEFSTYRTKRQGQRDLIQKISEHDEVVGSDGQHVGKVDHVRGDRIKLTKNDQAAGGHHHTIPSSWIESVDGNKVTISKTADEAKRAWREEQDDGDGGRGGRGLFGGSGNERDADDGSSNRNLNRSFSGTY